MIICCTIYYNGYEFNSHNIFPHYKKFNFINLKFKQKTKKLIEENKTK